MFTTVSSMIPPVIETAKYIHAMYISIIVEWEREY